MLKSISLDSPRTLRASRHEKSADADKETGSMDPQLVFQQASLKEEHEGEKEPVGRKEFDIASKYGSSDETLKPLRPHESVLTDARKKEIARLDRLRKYRRLNWQRAHSGHKSSLMSESSHRAVLLLVDVLLLCLSIMSLVLHHTTSGLIMSLILCAITFHAYLVSQLRYPKLTLTLRLDSLLVIVLELVYVVFEHIVNRHSFSAHHAYLLLHCGAIFTLVFVFAQSLQLARAERHTDRIEREEQEIDAFEDEATKKEHQHIEELERWEYERAPLL